MLHSGKNLLGRPVIGQLCIVPTSGSKLLGTRNNYIYCNNSYPGLFKLAITCEWLKFTYYEWLAVDLFFAWSLEPDAGTVNKLTLPVNTNARISHEENYEERGLGRRQHRSPRKPDTGPSILNIFLVHRSELVKAQPVCLTY